MTFADASPDAVPPLARTGGPMSALMRVVAPTAPLRRAPQSDAPLDTEALYGERVFVLEEREGWARGRLDRDGYEGFLPSEDLRPAGD